MIVDIYDTDAYDRRRAWRFYAPTLLALGAVAELMGAMLAAICSSLAVKQLLNSSASIRGLWVVEREGKWGDAEMSLGAAGKSAGATQPRVTGCTLERMLPPRLLLSLISVAAVWGQPARRPLKLDDLARMRDVRDPQCSPDGQSVAYVVSQIDGRQTILAECSRRCARKTSTESENAVPTHAS